MISSALQGVTSDAVPRFTKKTFKRQAASRKRANRDGGR